MGILNKAEKRLANSFGAQISKRALIPEQKYIPGALADYSSLVGKDVAGGFERRTSTYAQELASTARQYRSGINTINNSGNISKGEIDRLSQQSSNLYPKREPLSIGATRSAHTVGPLHNGTYQYGNRTPGTAPISNTPFKEGAFSNIYDGPKQGLWNKTKSIGQSVFNGMHSNEFESTVRRTGAYALGGAVGGLAYGMAGNVLSGGQLANTDPHMVRNAMFTGAMAGAFGMAKSGLGSMVRSQNHNITPFMKSFATKTMKAMDHPATSGAFFIAGFGGMSDSHLTRNISQVNFSGQPSR